MQGLCCIKEKNSRQGGIGRGNAATGKTDFVCRKRRENMGKKKLAYEVKKNKEAYYVVFTFEAAPESIAELERNYRITDEVIKFIVVRKDEK